MNSSIATILFFVAAVLTCSLGLWCAQRRLRGSGRIYLSGSAVWAGGAFFLVALTWGATNPQLHKLVPIFFCASLLSKLLLMVFFAADSRRNIFRAWSIVACCFGFSFYRFLLPPSALAVETFENVIVVPLHLVVLASVGLTVQRSLRGVAHSQFCYVFVAAILQGGVLAGLSSRFAQREQFETVLVVSGVALTWIEIKLLTVLSSLRLERFPICAGRVFRRLVSATILCAVYVASWNAIQIVLGASSPFLPALLAAFIAAAALYPARDRCNALYQYLFVPKQSIQNPAMVRECVLWLQSIHAIPEASRGFTELAQGLLHVERAQVLLRKDGKLIDGVTSLNATDSLPELESILAALDREQRPLVLDDLRRIPLTKETTAALESLQRSGFAMALSFSTTGGTAGLLLLSQVLGRGFFGRLELDVLQTLCETYATTVENFSLYSELLNARAYNSALIESLGSGVVACDLEGKITLCNLEAAKLLGRSQAQMLASRVAELPPLFVRPMQQALNSGEPIRNLEGLLAGGSDGQRTIRLSAAPFRSYADEPLGAMLVLNDITQLRTLQQRASRSDRRASLGTLAAGMAHEIKNPLVSVKTFTELLPLRYEDAEYREQFSTLVTREVDRIEEIVDHLLDFATPSKANLQPMNLHSAVNDAKGLVAAKCEKQNVSLLVSLDAPRDEILGDAKLLGQVLLNLLLNALEAMGTGGTLEVHSSACHVLKTEATSKPNTNFDGILLTVRDTGCGISAENISRIFDPFFTTKGSGTGLGLAITYGIIQEHGGVIDAESDGKTGTTFSIRLPLRNLQ